MNQGAVVVLDEFQYALETTLINAIKDVIDHFKSARSLPRREGKYGKLIITGSRHQTLFEIFEKTGPLCGRIDTHIALQEWRLKTILELASDHGFLRYPGRFLSMYSALGGLPQDWRRFVEMDDRRESLDSHESDEAWRRAFIAEQLAWLMGYPKERLWTSAAYIELAETSREVCLLLGRNQGGLSSQEIAEEIKNSWNKDEMDVHRSLELLHTHLQLIDCAATYTGGNPRWRISHHPALFQISVMDRFAHIESMERDPVSERCVAQLEHLDRTMIKRLAASWALELEGVSSSQWGVSMPGAADIDLLARQQIHDHEMLITGSCERQATAHRPQILTRQFNNFVAKVQDHDRQAEAELRALPHRRLLISPHFTPAQRKTYADSGFECVDIPDMAYRLGIPREPATEPMWDAIHAARTRMTAHRKTMAAYNQQRTQLEDEERHQLQQKAHFAEQLDSTSLFAWGRKRDLRAAMARAQDAAAAARTAIESLEEPPPLDPDVRTRARTPTQAEHQQQTARTAVRALEAEARFFARQRDPESAGPRDHPPDRSCIIVVAKPEHVPPENTEIEVRQWHHFAIWQPVHGAEELRMLSAAFPDSVLAPAPEVRSVWPFSRPQPDGPQADAALQSWGVTDHIDRVEGRDGESCPPPPPRRPDPEPSSGHEP